MSSLVSPLLGIYTTFGQSNHNWTGLQLNLHMPFLLTCRPAKPNLQRAAHDINCSFHACIHFSESPSDEIAWHVVVARGRSRAVIVQWPPAQKCSFPGTCNHSSRAIVPLAPVEVF